MAGGLCLLLLLLLQIYEKHRDVITAATLCCSLCQDLGCYA